MGNEVVVIGGGLSGISTAIELVEKDFSVKLFEKNLYLGGRASSFKDYKTGFMIDNGQHLMLGCYNFTFSFLKKIEAIDKIKIPKNLDLTFLNNKKKYRIKTNWFPAPFHFIFGLFNYKILSIYEKINLIRIITSFFINEKDLKSLSVEEWLSKHKQSENSQNNFWNIISIGALNNSSKNSSAFLFKNILKKIIFGSNKNSSFVIPEINLTDLFENNFVRYSKNKKIEINKNSIIKKLIIKNNSVCGIQFQNNKIINSNLVVLTTEPKETLRILKNSKLDKTIEFKAINKVENSMILNIHLWFDKKFTDLKFGAFLNSPLHWIFVKKENQKYFYINLVISSANEFEKINNSEILKTTLKELEKHFVDFSKSKLLHWKIIKSRDATFSQNIEIQKYRLPNKSTIKGLFFAGDWTDTKLPATIEGAIFSGVCAANEVLNFLNDR